MPEKAVVRDVQDLKNTLARLSTGAEPRKSWQRGLQRRSRDVQILQRSYAGGDRGFDSVPRRQPSESCQRHRAWHRGAENLRTVFSSPSEVVTCAGGAITAGEVGLVQASSVFALVGLGIQLFGSKDETVQEIGKVATAASAVPAAVAIGGTATVVARRSRCSPPSLRCSAAASRRRSRLACLAEPALQEHEGMAAWTSPTLKTQRRIGDASGRGDGVRVDKRNDGALFQECMLQGINGRINKSRRRGLE